MPKDALVLRALEETEQKGGENSRDPRRNRLLRALAPMSPKKPPIDSKKKIVKSPIRTPAKSTLRSPLGNFEFIITHKLFDSLIQTANYEISNLPCWA